MTGAVVWVNGTVRLGVFRVVEDDIINIGYSKGFLFFISIIFEEQFRVNDLLVVMRRRKGLMV